MKIDKEELLKAGIYVSTAALPVAMRRRLRLRWLAPLEISRCREADYVVLSRAKSGRTWLRAMLSALYQNRYGLPDDWLLEFDNFHRADRRIPKVAFIHGHRLSKAFDTLADEAWLAEKPLVFLVRHPCDVAVSEYFQSTRRAKAHKRELYGVDVDTPMFDFVMNGNVGLPAIVPYLNGWQRRVQRMPNALMLRYEDMRADPEGELARMMRHLDQPFSAEEIARAVEQCAFEVMKEKERANHYGNNRLAPRDPNDPDSYKVRRAKVGGYRDYFDAAQAAEMEAYVRRHLAPELGYHGEPVAGGTSEGPKPARPAGAS